MEIAAMRCNLCMAILWTFLLPSSSLAQEAVSIYRLEVKEFTVKPKALSLQHAARDVKDKLLEILSDDRELLIVLRGDDLSEAQREVDYQQGQPELFDPATMLRADSSLIGANLSLSGAIVDEGGRFKVTIQIAEPESGTLNVIESLHFTEPEFEERAENFESKVRDLGRRLAQRIKQESLVEPIQLAKDENELAGFLANDVSRRRAGGSEKSILMEPMTYRDTGTFSPFSVFFKRFLASKLTGLETDQGKRPEKELGKRYDPFMYAENPSSVGFVFGGSYWEASTRYYFFLTYLKDVTNGSTKALHPVAIQSEVLKKMGHDLFPDPNCKLEYWSRPCSPWTPPSRNFGDYAIPGSYHIRNGRSRGWFLVSGTVLSAAGLAISIPAYNDARSNRNAAGRTQAQVDHYDQLMDRWQVGIIVSGTALATSYLINTILLK